MSQLNENSRGKVNNDEVMQIITFKVGKEEFSVSIFKVQEIIRMSEITNVPNSPPFVEGVINLRGKVIPVIDSRKRFGMPSAERTDDSRVIVVDSDGQIVGLIVDSVTEVLQLSRDTIEQPPEITGNVTSDYIEGVGKYEDRLVILLDLEKFLTFNNAEQVEAAPVTAVAAEG